MKSKIKFSNILSGTVMILVLGIILFPFVWLVFGTLKPTQEIITYPPTIIPSNMTLDNYTRVWDSIPLLRYLLNTFIFSVSVVILSLLFDSMAGYAFARLRFKGKQALFIGVLLTMMIPFQVIMIPLFVLEFKINILNTFSGLILPRATSAFGIYLMRSFFISLPKSLEESARIDGLGEFGIFFRIMLPLCKPALISLGVILLINNWNDLIYPLMLTNNTEMRTISAGLAMFVGDKAIDYGAILASTVISIIPLVVLYLMFQKYFVKGIAATGIKE